MFIAAILIIFRKWHACQVSYVWFFVTLCCSLPGSTVQGILQARIFEQVAKKQNIDTYNMDDPKIHLPSNKHIFLTSPLKSFDEYIKI